ncbi:phosphatidylinositol-trisphosphate 3-phosphatase [Acrasis kona]|uniref:Phosphatidylinositol-trisphosphate 3-phosphatase n=1 Tax=Acrasis kona TaxID=1008807 RepID=A0AAW2ZHR7_9EUKA
MWLASNITKPIKYAVSGTRYRHIEGGYDLDLAYITNRIIAMGFPGDGIEGMYRNNGAEVARFLKEKHDGHYMIWNLSEKHYSHEKFDNQVLEFGFPDHHNPPLDLLFQICKSMDSWLKADQQNVAIVGQAVLFAAYLIYVGLITDPIEALAYFAMRRSYQRVPKELQDLVREGGVPYVLSLGGVNSPSQIRYVQYFKNVLSNYNSITQNKMLQLRKLYIHQLSPVMRKQIVDGHLIINFFEMISVGPNQVDRKLLFSTNNIDRVGDMSIMEDIISYTLNNVILCGDILITCNHRNAIRDEKVFRFSFHTGFIGQEYVFRLKKTEMDEACHNKTNYIQEDFMIDLMFSDVELIPSDQQTPPEQQEERSFDHLYAKQDPNTRNHILLEHSNDNYVQEVIKSKNNGVMKPPVPIGMPPKNFIQ